ncbi:TonB-dependent receptor [Brevundimonas sp. 2R-24]|uniref:TonB-dependent receptor n=1 Tax=Peiella sedimenti TaxID=3061083 RepID=A0ABT8SJ15_9CAUL|nr:TonB-dependent receptor [Caulobacteraceae bacterium XZ-24]
MLLRTAACLLASATLVHAQEAPQAPAAPAAAETGGDQQGVLTFEPAYFADAQPSTAMDMINRLPGFSFTGGDSARGFAGTAGNVLIDGRRPASKSDNLNDIVSRIPASQVVRIEIIRGGAPGIDMQGHAVVANIVRSRADSVQQAFQVGVSFMTGDGRIMPGARYEATRTRGETISEFMLQRFVNMDDSTGDTTRVVRDGSGAVILDQLGYTEGDGFGYGLRASHRMPLGPGTFRVGLTGQTSNFKEDEIFAPGNFRGRSGGPSGELSLNYTLPLATGWEGEGIFIQRLSEGTYRSVYTEPGVDQEFLSETNSGETIGRGILRWRRSDTLSFEGGGEAAFNFLEGHIELYDNGAPVPLPSADVRVEERRGELFGQMTWRPIDRWTIEAGSRFETSTISQSGDSASERSFFYPKPRVSVSWSPSETFQLRGRIEREVGQLDFGDFVSSASLQSSGVVTAGNADLRPQRAWVYEAALERRFWGNGALVLTYQHQEIEDAIDRVPIIGPGYAFDAPGNIGNGTSDQIQATLTLPLERMGMPGGQLRANTVFINSEVTDPTTGEVRRQSGQRPDTIELTLRQDIPSMNLNWNVHYFGGWEEAYYRFNDVQNLEIRNYFQAQLEYKPSPSVSILAQLQNFDPFQFHLRRTRYDGPRDVSPVLFSEHITRQSQPRVYFRVRKTF